MPNVIRQLLSSSSGTCQNPFLASATVKTFAFVSLASKSSVVGKGYLSRFRALLSGFESMHSRTLPLRFDVTIIEDTQSKGTSTRTRNPLATSLSSSR